MGSAKLSNAKPKVIMEDKKPNKLINTMKALKNLLSFNKSERTNNKQSHKASKKTANKNVKEITNEREVKVENPVIGIDHIAALMKNFENNRKEAKKEATQETEADKDLTNFSFNKINVEGSTRSERIDSVDSGIVIGKDNDVPEASVPTDDANEDPSNKAENADSGDKGYAEGNENDDISKGMKNLTINDVKPKEKRSKIVFASRKPVKTKVANAPKVAPYTVPHEDVCYEQTSLNRQSLSGGHVIVNNQTSLPSTKKTLQLDSAFDQLQSTSQPLTNDPDYLKDVDEMVLNELAEPTEIGVDEEYYWPELFDEKQLVLSDCTLYDPQNSLQQPSPQDQTLYGQINDQACMNYDTNAIGSEFRALQNAQQSIPVENIPSNYVNMEATNDLNYTNFEDNVSNGVSESFFDDIYHSSENIFLTPPYYGVLSPLSEAQSQVDTAQRSHFNSPLRSPPNYSSDLERYQDIPFESPKSIENVERSSPISKMSLKQYKDFQNEIVSQFSKLDCCQENRKSCKEIFEEHFVKLPKVVRSDLCLKLANFNLDHAYGVLHNILLNMRSDSDKEDLQYALFYLICERVLAQNPSQFAHNFGLSLLKAAALQCPARPLLTRYVVQCIRAALGSDRSLYLGKEFIYDEVDVLGDNLLIACARKGDKCAAVLAEIVKKYDDQPPLFHVDHTNSNGHTCLHVACGEAAQARVTVHVLLKHAQADLWKGDSKSGDTPVHLAVNSATCDLQVIMILFKHIDRKEWKELARCNNMSSVTPLDHARAASRSKTRQNYPLTVLEFLKRCR